MATLDLSQPDGPFTIAEAASLLDTSEDDVRRVLTESLQQSPEGGVDY